MGAAMWGREDAEPGFADFRVFRPSAVPPALAWRWESGRDLHEVKLFDQYFTYARVNYAGAEAYSVIPYRSVTKIDYIGVRPTLDIDFAGGTVSCEGPELDLLDVVDWLTSRIAFGGNPQPSGIRVPTPHEPQEVQLSTTTTGLTCPR